MSDKKLNWGLLKSHKCPGCGNTLESWQGKSRTDGKRSFDGYRCWDYFTEIIRGQEYSGGKIGDACCKFVISKERYNEIVYGPV